MENKQLNESFLKKTFPENYKISTLDASHYKIETPFLDDFKTSITLYIDATAPSGKIKILDAKTIFGKLGPSHKKDIGRIKTYVEEHFPKNCHFASEDEELIYEIEIKADDRWFSEKFRFSVHNFMAFLSKLYSFVKLST